MRYRTAAILSIVLIGGMFVIPAVIESTFLPSLKQGTPDPLPGYEQILLAVAAFFLGWRFVLALPIALVLFTVAAFTGPAKVRQQHRTHRLESPPTNRPVGITVIALLNILSGLVLGVSIVLSVHRPEGGLAWISVAVVILSICLGVALLKMQNWARAVVIVLYGLSLIRMTGHVIFTHGAADGLALLVPGCYVLWAIWYMHQQHVKAAFGGT